MHSSAEAGSIAAELAAEVAPVLGVVTGRSAFETAQRGIGPRLFPLE